MKEGRQSGKQEESKNLKIKRREECQEGSRQKGGLKEG